MQRVAWHFERRRYDMRNPKISSTERRLSDLNMIQSDDICMACLGFFLFWSLSISSSFLSPWQIALHLDLDLFGREKVSMGLAGSALF